MVASTSLVAFLHPGIRLSSRCKGFRGLGLRASHQALDRLPGNTCGKISCQGSLGGKFLTCFPDGLEFLPVESVLSISLGPLAWEILRDT